MEILNETKQITKDPVYGNIQVLCCDAPARTKANGTALVTCHDHMCGTCDCTFPSLVDAATYDPHKL